VADVSAALNSWSTTASSNSPNDNTTIGSGLADNLQQIQAVVRGDLASVGSAIASSAAPDVGAVTGLYHSVSGNATISGLGSSATAGIWKILKFESTPVLKHSTALSMITSADVTASAGAVGVFVCEGTNQWKNIAFNPYPGASTTSAGVFEAATSAEALAGTSDAVAITPSALSAVLGMVKLASGTATNTAIADITMSGYTSFANKLLVLKNFVPATDNTGLWMRASSDNASSFAASSTAYAYVLSTLVAGSSSPAVSGSNGASQVALIGSGADNLTATGGVNGRIYLYGTTDTTDVCVFNWHMSNWNNDATVFTHNDGGGSRSANEDVDAIRLLFATGNIGCGQWTLYGFN